MPEKELRPAEAGKSTPDSSAAEMLIEGSETFAYFKKNGIKPPNQDSWNKVLFDLGADMVEKQRGALQAYAEAHGDKNLARALSHFNAEAARLVAEMDEDEAEGKYRELLDELRELEGAMPDIQEKLAYHLEQYKTDLDHDHYIDEFEGKLAAAKKRTQSINGQLEMMRSVFYIPDELVDEQFRV